MHFSYKAKDPSGTIHTGDIEAKDQKTAFSLLKKRQFLPIYIKEKAEGFDINKLLERLSGISLKDKVIFTRQLSSIISAGIPLLQALQLTYQQTGNAKLKDVVQTVIDDIQSGMTFGDALAKHPRVFSNFFINLVKAGEASGTLDNALVNLADQLEKDSEIRGKIRGALILPGLVMVVMVGVIILMSVVVIPQLEELFAQAESQLPLPTRIMQALSFFLINYWWMAILLVIGSVVGSVNFLRTKRGQYLFETFSLKVPVFGKLLKLVIYARMTRVTSILLQAGVPLLKSLTIVSDLVGNHIYAESIKRVKKKIEMGIPLAEAYQEEGDIYPLMVSQLIGIGEQTGTVDEMLGKVADFYDNEVENMVKNLTTLLEPMLMIIMGGMVGFIVMAVLMPIYGLVNVIE